ncbi:MAG TPA: hypothetical protein VFH35_03280 [Ramlibacter sp.]|nr:hypothetical protein [Ramlibacter sp.]
MSPKTGPSDPMHKPEADASEARTPGTDMQPEDVGTPASGNDARGTAAEAASKQTSKTQHESGSRRDRQ